jgi:alkylation response protein AidB-like acyl-CoA dehydrogenase
MTARHAPAARSRDGFLGQLFAGHLRWDLLLPFPRQDPDDARRGAAVIADMRAFLSAHVDPEDVEARGALPPGYVAGLRAHRLLDLGVGPELGGRGLSFLNVMRAIESAMSWCLPAGYVLALQNGFGAAGVLPTIPPGPTRDYVLEHVRAGAVSGWADTEPSGAGNALAATVAVPAPGGGYFLTGRKIYIVNGAFADLLVLTATLERDGRAEARVFFVDTRAAGYRVELIHDLMGLRGLPIAALALDRVFVPEAALLVTPEAHWRDTPLLEPISALARMYAIIAASLAVAKRCVAWDADFVARRGVDGRALDAYEAIRRLRAASAAEVYALESVALASLVGLDYDTLATRWFEQVAAKNLASRAAARVVERTMSLTSAEGYETAPSKARRGAPAVPVERAYRDARAFRIAGGVDFLIDYYAAREGLLACYYPTAPAELGPAERAASTKARAEAALSRRNAAHADHAAAEVARLGAACRELRARHADASELAGRQHLLMALARVAHELFAVCAALARAASGAEPDQALADVYCTDARHRLRAAWSELAAEPEPGLDASVAACLALAPPA